MWSIFKELNCQGLEALELFIICSYKYSRQRRFEGFVSKQFYAKMGKGMKNCQFILQLARAEFDHELFTPYFYSLKTESSTMA